MEGLLPQFVVAEAAPDLDAVRASRQSGLSSQIGNGVLELCRAADITFLALHGGIGENGSLQAFFDLCDVRYTGSSSIGCALAMDKGVSKSLLRGEDILTADWTTARRGDSFDTTPIPVPCVVKPNSGGSSIGVTIVSDKESLASTVEAGFQYEDELIVEQYVSGMELSAGVLGIGGELVALPLIEIVPKHGFYDYRHKYQKGWTDEIVPARISDELTKRVQTLALAAFRALKLDVYARVDFLLTPDGRAFCLEANTLPGLTPTSLLPQEAEKPGWTTPRSARRSSPIPCAGTKNNEILSVSGNPRRERRDILRRSGAAKQSRFGYRDRQPPGRARLSVCADRRRAARRPRVHRSRA